MEMKHLFLTERKKSLKLKMRLKMKKNREIRESAYNLTRNVLRPLLRTVIKTECIGRKNIPKKGKALIVSNHRSDLDPFLLMLECPRPINWIAAQYLRHIPIYRTIIRKLGAILTDTSGNKMIISAMRDIVTRLKGDELVGIFPEGDEWMLMQDFSAPMAPFHSGFATLAVKFNVPCVPAVVVPVKESILKYPLPSSVRRLIGIPEIGCRVQRRIQYWKVRIVFLPPLYPQDFKTGDKKEAIDKLTQAMREKISSCFQEHLIYIRAKN